MKKRYLLLTAIIFCVLLIAFILWPQKKTMPPIVETSLPVSEQKAYVDKINVALEKDRKERSAYEKIKDTPKEVAKRKNTGIN
jgi:cation transport regulator ChaB